MLLVVNCGSSSVKLVVFDRALAEVGRATVERIGAGGPQDHDAALTEGLKRLALPVSTFRAAAHRVVHGAGRHVAARVDDKVLADVKAAVRLAPLHNPANLMGIAAVARLVPDLPQYVSFDTAFHAGNPAVAVTYALPLFERDQGLRRYGFHGLSYAAIVRKVKDIRKNELPERLLSFHLGNGASACAILNGLSVATTMGYSPLDGLTMGTRGGAMDPAVVLDLAARHGAEGAARILNRESGLLGLGGNADMRSLRSLGTPEAEFAIEHFCYWAARHGASLIAAMGGLDAIAFTGGIGENDKDVRTRILNGLDWIAKGKPVHVIPADEERQIALEARALMEAGQ